VGPSFVTELTLHDADGALSDIFDRGAPIELRLTVRNRLSTPATVESPDTRTVDFVVIRDSDGQPVGAGVYEARGALIYDGFDTDPLRSHEMGSTLERFSIL
jgi:hypothetical protein